MGTGQGGVQGTVRKARGAVRRVLAIVFVVAVLLAGFGIFIIPGLRDQAVGILNDGVASIRRVIAPEFDQVLPIDATGPSVPGHEPSNLIDADPKTWWEAEIGSDHAGKPIVVITFAKPASIDLVRLQIGQPDFQATSRPSSVLVEFTDANGVTTTVQQPLKDTQDLQQFDVAAAKVIKIRIQTTAYNVGGGTTTAIPEIRFYAKR